MVGRRTADIDALLNASLTGGLRQLVLVGAGLDFRAARLAGGHASLRVFEIDLPEMLAERERVLREMDLTPGVIRTQVPANLEFDDVASAVVSAGFDPALPSLLLYEGMSMYFSEALNRQILTSLASLLHHPDSRLWLDAVTASALHGASGDAEAEAFLEGMARLGEPFTFGLDDAAGFFGASGLAVLSDTPCTEDARRLFQLYRFYVLTRLQPPPIEEAL
jgi:methyltransferase (TIGR00027 family)